MKPSRKQIESRVMELSATLPTLREKDSEWIDTNFRTRWKNKGLCYYVILERKNEWQVIRWYYKSCRRRFEVMQVWLDGTNEVVLARRRFMRYDGWVADSVMKPKRISKYASYSYLGDVRYCPQSESRIRSIIPALKRNGLRTSLYGLYSPYALVKSLLDCPRIETLWKLRQFALVDYFYWGHHLSDTVWQSIRVALRHGYRFNNYKQVQDWEDMIHMMERVGADTHNPQLICPADLKAAHDHWMRVRNRTQEREKFKREKREAKAYEPTFHVTREQFLDMVLTDGKITIKAIPTAYGIIEEGRAMHHCVGGYFNRRDSLILSATINGERVETIEVSLTTYNLVQSRGLQNESTKYHKRIVKLIKQSLETIRRLDMAHKEIEQKKLNELIKKAS